MISSNADRNGFAATLFGSTLKRGSGRDLDVVMLSRFGEQPDFRKFLAEFGGVMVRQMQRADRGGHSYEVERAGKLFHFIFGRF